MLDHELGAGTGAVPPETPDDNTTTEGETRRRGSRNTSTDHHTGDHPTGDHHAGDHQAGGEAGRKGAVTFQAPGMSQPLFQAPEIAPIPSYDDEQPASEERPSRRRRTRGSKTDSSRSGEEEQSEAGTPDKSDTAATDSPKGAAKSTESGTESDEVESDEGEGSRRRRRRRGGRRRHKGDADEGSDQAGETADKAAGQDQTGEQGASETASEEPGDDEQTGGGSRRRRRRRRRKGEVAEPEPDDPANTVVRVREPRKAKGTEVTQLEGSTRLEAKKQRRREGREAGRRRPPILTEAEFLARRESVDRTMVIRQEGERTQIGVLEDGVLVEHYVAKNTQTSLIGNVYLGRVQNVLPSMEAAFIDIGKGRNAVLYAGEVDWTGLGVDSGQPKRIESALKSGQSVLVQVTKDPLGHKGARLTSQISLPGRYLVYVPHGSMNGISRKLPDTERTRLKQLLKEIVPEESGVVVRTAAEGASEDELSRDVTRLRAQWDAIEKKSESSKAPELVYAEPDLLIKVVRDLFTEDFTKLVVSGGDASDMVDGYVRHVAPHLMERVERWTANEDVFSAYRIDEQIMKALDRKVWLPSGGSLIIERTEAMTVIDVNTGKFTGSGGNLEETVTKNNLEAAEEIVRQLRLRDIGGIVVVDFIDMVLESNRDLVLRRLVECLGRDRTKHQVAEVTSLGLVQMTRKRIGTGLLESYSEPCEHCKGRGVKVRMEPVDGSSPESGAGSNGSRSGSEPASASTSSDGESGGGGRRSRRRRRGGGGGSGSDGSDQSQESSDQSAESSEQVGPSESGAQTGAAEVDEQPEGEHRDDLPHQRAADHDPDDGGEEAAPREPDDTPSVAAAVEPDVEPVETGSRRRRSRRRSVSTETD